jgi:hypothetical protein
MSNNLKANPPSQGGGFSLIIKANVQAKSGNFSIKLKKKIYILRKQCFWLYSIQFYLLSSIYIYIYIYILFFSKKKNFSMYNKLKADPPSQGGGFSLIIKANLPAKSQNFSIKLKKKISILRK